MLDAQIAKAVDQFNAEIDTLLTNKVQAVRTGLGAVSYTRWNYLMVKTGGDEVNKILTFKNELLAGILNDMVRGIKKRAILRILKDQILVLQEKNRGYLPKAGSKKPVPLKKAVGTMLDKTKGGT